MNATPHTAGRWAGMIWRAALPACLLLALSASGAMAGDDGARAPNRLSKQIDSYRGKADSLTRVNLFQPTTQSAARDSITQLAVSSGTLINLDTAAIAQLQKNRPASITLSLPTRERGAVELELFAHDIFAPDFAVSASGGEDTSKIQRGLHYRGVVKGEAQSIAAISVFDNEIVGTFSTPTDGNWVVGKVKGQQRSTRHIVYSESALVDKKGAPSCALSGNTGARQSLATFSSEQKVADSSIAAATSSGVEAVQTAKCATEWLEAEYDIYQNLGSLQATTNYLTGVFNNSAALYANDGISLKLQQAHVWTTVDPYNGNDSSSNLASFQRSRAGSFVGTIAQLLTFRPLGGGIAAGYSGICNATRANSMSTSSVEAAYSAVPTYSWSVGVITHEAGHLLGSYHTHACAWNGNNTAIDGCWATEGTCARPGIPNGGGTIMSYCHLTGAGINFNNGFGAQPANIIRNNVEAGGCLANCDGAPVGGGALTKGVAKTNQSAPSGASLDYTLVVPAGATNLTFTSSGGSGDADMLVNFGSAPTDTDFDCDSHTSNNNEVCTFAAPSPGTYYVRLKAYATFSGVSLLGDYGSGSGTVQTYSNLTDVAIADYATVDSPIAVTGRSGNAPRNALVSVNILHTYQGDLKVDLVAPDGQLFNIHDRTGGANDNVIKKDLVFDLSAYALNNTWKLRVNDNGPGDIGKIDSWSIKF